MPKIVTDFDKTFLIICFEEYKKDMAIDFSYWQPCWYNNGSKGQKMVLFQNMYIFDSIFMIGILYATAFSGMLTNLT